MSESSDSSSHHSTPHSSSASSSSRSCHCLYGTNNEPHNGFVDFHQEELPDSPDGPLGTIDQPIEVSSGVETDPSEIHDSQVHIPSSLSIGSQEYYSYSGSVEDVTEQMRQPGTMAADPIEISSDSHHDTQASEASTAHLSLSAYLCQTPPTPDVSPHEPVMQGPRLVQDYFREFLNSPLYDVYAEQGICEVMVAFLTGLRPELQAVVVTRVYLSLPEMVNFAMDVELEQIRNRTTRRYPGSMGNRGCTRKGPRGTRGRRGNQGRERPVTPPPGFGSGTSEESGSGGSGRDED